MRSKVILCYTVWEDKFSDRFVTRVT